MRIKGRKRFKGRMRSSNSVSKKGVERKRLSIPKSLVGIVLIGLIFLTSQIQIISKNFVTSILDVNLKDAVLSMQYTQTSTHGNNKNSRRRLPTLLGLTAIPDNYTCPNGTSVFEDIVLPESITHANRKIPMVVHMTAPSRCVSDRVRKHLERWKFPNHSLYLHDDGAVYQLLDYAIRDYHGYELVANFSKMVLCMTHGATLSDVWRYTLLYHYGGIYTDIDNAPGPAYKPEHVTPETDSFFYVEGLGIMSQYYMAVSRHHPLALCFLWVATFKLYEPKKNVMINNPAHNTGPQATKVGMIIFQKGANVKSNGYLPEGLYHGDLTPEMEAILPWYNQDVVADDNEYPSPFELRNRTVTVYGRKEEAIRYIKRTGMGHVGNDWKSMNMTKYRGFGKQFPMKNCLTCPQHVQRIEILTKTNTSFYYQKSSIAELRAQYKYCLGGKYYYLQDNERSCLDGHYYDPNTNTKVDSNNLGI